jgi:hypothetical protein
MAMAIPISLLLLLAALTLALRRDWRVALFARVWPGRRSDSTLPANL